MELETGQGGKQAAQVSHGERGIKWTASLICWHSDVPEFNFDNGCQFQTILIPNADFFLLKGVVCYLKIYLLICFVCMRGGHCQGVHMEVRGQLLMSLFSLSTLF